MTKLEAEPVAAEDPLSVWRVEGKELAELKRFYRHRCKARTYDGRRNPSVTVSFTSTGIGTAVEVSCHCGLKRNITDYDGW